MNVITNSVQRTQKYLLTVPRKDQNWILGGFFFCILLFLFIIYKINAYQWFFHPARRASFISVCFTFRCKAYVPLEKALLAWCVYFFLNSFMIHFRCFAFILFYKVTEHLRYTNTSPTEKRCFWRLHDTKSRPKCSSHYAGGIWKRSFISKARLNNTHWLGAFRERCLSQRNLKTAVLYFCVGAKIFEMGTFEKWWRHDNNVISLPQFSSNTNPK